MYMYPFFPECSILWDKELDFLVSVFFACPFGLWQRITSFGEKIVSLRIKKFSTWFFKWYGWFRHNQFLPCKITVAFFLECWPQNKNYIWCILHNCILSKMLDNGTDQNHKKYSVCPNFRRHTDHVYFAPNYPFTKDIVSFVVVRSVEDVIWEFL